MCSLTGYGETAAIGAADYGIRNGQGPYTNSRPTLVAPVHASAHRIYRASGDGPTILWAGKTLTALFPPLLPMTQK
jgi:hypothetical protein